MLNEIDHDLSRIDLNLLVVFEAVLAERHVGRAAARLHLSPSAVSHGVARLRRLFGDPLFLKHPKGVVPSARAADLAEPIAQILRQVRRVVESADPFDPARSARRFVVGAPDGVGTVVLPPVVAAIRREAPGIDVGVRDLAPIEILGALDARDVDVALYPLEELPARFAARALYQEDFVVAARRGHPLAKGPPLDLDRYCAAHHLLVSPAGDTRGFVDELLAPLGRSRRVVLTVPGFVWALAVVSETDLVAALPRRLVGVYGARFGVVALEPPIPLMPSQVRVVAPKVALADAGVARLLGMLVTTPPPPASPPRGTTALRPARAAASSKARAR